MSDKQNLYNIVFSLLEEEVFQRTTPGSFTDTKYNDFSSSVSKHTAHRVIGGGKNNEYMAMIPNHSKSFHSHIPGKFDIVRNQYCVPIDVAIKGSLERQKLFLLEKNYNNVR